MQDFQYFLLLEMDKAKKHKGEWKLQIWKHELGFQTQTKVRECLNLSMILDKPIIELWVKYKVRMQSETWIQTELAL